MNTNRWVVPGLIGATFLSLLHYLAFSPLLPAIAADLHVEVGQLGQMPAAVGLLAAGIGLVAGPLADRYGPRRTLLLGLLALVASATGMAVLPGVAALPLVAILAGTGRATVYPLALAIASAEYTGDDQRRAVSRITSSLGAAPILGVPVVACVAAAVDWRAAWLALALVTAAACVALRPVLRRPHMAHRGAPVRELIRAYQLLLRHRPSLALLGVTFTAGASGWSIWTYLGAFLVRQHGFSTQDAGWAWVVVGVGLFVGTLLAGGKLGGIPLDLVLVLGSIGVGLSLGLAYVLPLAGWVAVAVMGVGTLLHGMTQVVTAVLLPNAAPTGRAATMTLRGAASSLGGATGAAVGGLLLDASGFALVGASALAFGMVAAALAWWIREPAAPRVAATLAYSDGSSA